MRLVEMLLLAVLAMTLISRFVRRDRRPGWLRFAPALLVALTAVHLLREHYRWQMVPGYALVAVLALRALRTERAPAPTTRGRRLRRGLAVVGGLGGVGLSWLLGAGFPIFTYPAPTGPYGVGTTKLFFVDRARVDSFAPEPNRPRELLAAVWYPADVPTKARRDPFWPPGSQPSEAIGLPAFLFSHVPLVPAHSVAEAPLAAAEREYPVIVYSHGFNSTPWQNVPQMEQLASHGFVVVSIGHSYDATVLTFPDGRVVRDNSRRRSPNMTPADFRTFAALTKRLAAETDPTAIRARWREAQEFGIRHGLYVTRSIPVWVDDTRFVVDQLAAIDTAAGGRLRGRLDLERLGLFGMSFGGSTAGLFCMRDSRCKAGINFDGWQFGDPDATPLRVPFLHATREANNEFPVYASSTADLFQVHVRGAEHGSFSDMILIAPIFTWIARYTLPLLGTIEAPAMERIMTDYSLAFFQRYLRGQPQPLLTASTPVPNVDLTFRPAPPPEPAVGGQGRSPAAVRGVSVNP